MISAENLSNTPPALASLLDQLNRPANVDIRQRMRKILAESYPLLVFWIDRNGQIRAENR